LGNTATLSATRAPKGKQPEISRKQAKKERATGFGSVNPLTGQPVTGFAETGNAGTFKRHSKRVLKACRWKQKIIVHADNVHFHRAKILKPFLQAHSEPEIGYLPAYSPDMNPVERVRWYMRKGITHNRYLSSPEERVAKFRRLMSGTLKPNVLLKNICVINF
jgi:putative transposase